MANYLCYSLYDSSKLRNTLLTKNYIPIIPQNRRNIKNKNKIIKFSRYEKMMYKKRMIIENSYSWLKNYRRINPRDRSETDVYRYILHEFYIFRFDMYIYK